MNDRSREGRTMEDRAMGPVDSEPVDSWPTDSRRPATVCSVGALALAGAGAGLVAKWADAQGPSWLADLTTGRALWVAIAFAIGRTAASRSAALLGSPAFFSAMVASYYAYTRLVLGYPLGRTALAWLLVALIACPVVALIVQATAGRQVAGAVTAGVMAAVVLSDGDVHRMLLHVTGELGAGPFHLGAGLLTVGLAVGIVATVREPRRILLAAVTALILAPFLSGVLDQLIAALGAG